MKKILPLIAVLVSGFSFAQCDISTFIQDNYEFDAKVLALREIQDDPLDPDYTNPFLPEVRITPFLEKLSAIHENPDNEPVIDSLFNEFQMHANATYINYVYYKRFAFSIDNSISWLDDFINTGVSGNPILNDLM